MISHTVMDGASTKIFASRPAAAAVGIQARERFVPSLVPPVQIRVCDESRFQLITSDYPLSIIAGI